MWKKESHHLLPCQWRETHVLVTDGNHEMHWIGSLIAEERLKGQDTDRCTWSR
ncbi:predicted protein [Botrytis cinerea T4]|uniref:Uncharacterized protein n=1 Tax=Botryotinia fuckeliana (strain T4) TaxID=999810 RepID=G2XVR6_BOTF4|nr:predicted protein [Botrytis cinerea T4]